MKKPNAGITLVFLSVILSIGCKKKKVDEIPVNEKVGAYAALGYNYLFSVDKNNNDSIMPVFIGKTNQGDYKLIVKEFLKGNSNNKALKQNGSTLNNWAIAPDNFNLLKKQDKYELDDNGFITINKFYLEKNNTTFDPASQGLSQYSVIFYDGEDLVSLEKASKIFVWPESNPKALTNIKVQKVHTRVIYENCYNASYSKQGEYTYFLYTVPDNLLGNTGAHLNFSIEKNNQVVNTVKLLSGPMTKSNGCDYSYVSGLNFTPIMNQKGQQPYYIISDRQISVMVSGRSVSILNPFPTNHFMSAMVYGNLDEKLGSFFTLNSDLYYTGYNGSNQYWDCCLFKLVGTYFVKQDLSLKGIKGIFGNENGIIAVIQNVERS